MRDLQASPGFRVYLTLFAHLVTHGGGSLPSCWTGISHVNTGVPRDDSVTNAMRVSAYQLTEHVTGQYPHANGSFSTGVPRGKSATSASCVAAYRMTAEGATPAGMLVPPRDRLKVLSVVRALADANGFITGAP